MVHGEENVVLRRAVDVAESVCVCVCVCVCVRGLCVRARVCAGFMNGAQQLESRCACVCVCVRACGCACV